MNEQEKVPIAVRAARMYYYQNMKTELIAKEMNFSRSTISRLLSFAKSEGLVDIQIVDPSEEPQRMEKRILERFDLCKRTEPISVIGHFLDIVTKVLELAGRGISLQRFQESLGFVNLDEYFLSFLLGQQTPPPEGQTASHVLLL